MVGPSYLADPEAQRLPKGRAYSYIRDRIISGAWPGGSKLQPERIALELGVSRMPVRDAISQLDAEGLVTVRPNQGAIVTLLPANEIAELFEMRAVLEGLAARTAAEHLAEGDLDEMRMLNERLMRTDLEIPKWLGYHNQFHDLVCEIGHQRHIQQEIRRVRTAVQPYLLMYFQEYRQSRMAGDEHQLLIDAIASRNGLLAERAFRDHVLRAAQSHINFAAAQQREAETKTQAES